MLILGLNPSFGGFFSQNFQKLKITKFKTPGRKRTRGHVRSHPQKSITFAGGGGREEEDLGFHSTLQKRCASRKNSENQKVKTGFYCFPKFFVALRAGFYFQKTCGGVLFCEICTLCLLRFCPAKPKRDHNTSNNRRAQRFFKYFRKFNLGVFF